MDERARGAEHEAVPERAGQSSVEAFAKKVAGRVALWILGFLRELSGEAAYRRYVEDRRRRQFPEGCIMTRREFERWRADAREQRAEMRC